MPKFCAFCDAIPTPDAPTLSQHLKRCEAYRLAMLEDVPSAKPKRHQPTKPDSSAPFKPCARCKVAARASGSVYCPVCKRQMAAEHNSTRHGSKPALRRITRG